MKSQLLRRIHDRSAVVGIVGLGYVGLPLAVEFAKAGFRVVGVDVDSRKVEALNAGRSYIPDVTTDDVATLRAAGRLYPLFPISIAAGRFVAVLTVQPKATPQLGVLGLQTSVFGLQASVFGLQAGILGLQVGILNLQAEILGAQVRHLRLEVGNFGLQSSQLLEQDIYCHQLRFGHDNSLVHFPFGTFSVKWVGSYTG